jgi:hypothetical protein
MGKHRQEPTNVRVYRSLIDYSVVPHDRVDELHEAAKTCPRHVQASARIPSCAVAFLDPGFNMHGYFRRTFKVPVERDGTHHESNEREGRIDLVRRRRESHRSSRMRRCCQTRTIGNGGYAGDSPELRARRKWIPNVPSGEL